MRLRPGMTSLVVAAVAATAVVLAPDTAAAAAPLVTERFVIGRSVQHRDITVVHRFVPAADGGVAPGAAKVVVIGNIHGDERAGLRVISRLRDRTSLPTNVDLYLIRTANPDGTAAGTRTNAHGVDLNRNFPYRWRTSSRGATWSGRRALSEPEALTLRAFVAQVRPDLVVVFHQPLFGIGAQEGTMPVVRRLSAATGLPVRDFTCTGICAGSFTSWLNNRTSSTGVTVEFGHTASASRIARAAHAVLSVGAGFASVAGGQ